MQPSIRWCFTTAWCKSRYILVWRKDTYWFIHSGSHCVTLFRSALFSGSVIAKLLFDFVETEKLWSPFSGRMTQETMNTSILNVKHRKVLFNDECRVGRILFVVVEIKCSKRSPVWYTAKIQMYLPTTSSFLLHGVLYLNSCWSSLGE